MARQSKKRSAKLTRGVDKRESYDLVLIVTEGERTEPNYFHNLIKNEKLSSANIVITGECGSNPISVVNEGLARLKQSKKGGPSTTYDRVYCLFDRDEHQNFEAAIKKAKDNNIEIICSYPCFEYWYLCHFEYSRAAFSKSGNQSGADNCVQNLKRHWKNEFNKDYSKADKTVYTQLKPKMEIAYKHAKRATKDTQTTQEPNPSTNVNELVEYLLNLKKVK